MNSLSISNFEYYLLVIKIEIIEHWHFIVFVLFTPFLLAGFLKLTRRVSVKKARSHKYVMGLDWREFEILIAKYYKSKGFKVSLEGGAGGDNGIDVTLKRGKNKTIVQCKHWKARSIGVSIIREMFGVMISEGAENVIVVTSGKFTKEAYKFAENKPIELINGTRLNYMLNL